jgi:hypothetical protein
MANAADQKNAQSATTHIQAAKSAPNRKDLELTQAENFAKLIKDMTLRSNTESAIRAAR